VAGSPAQALQAAGNELDANGAMLARRQRTCEDAAMAEAGLSEETVVARSGASPEFVRHLLELGILAPTPGVGLTDADVRRVRVVEALDGAGLSLEGLVQAMRDGLLSLDFVEQPAYSRYDSLTEMTFRELSEARGLPLELGLIVREAAGGAEARPDDRVRESELPIIAAGEKALRHGVRPETLAWTMRVYGESLRRLTETEADLWAADILAPLIRDGITMPEIIRRTSAITAELSAASDESLLASYHSHQSIAWMRNIFEGFEATLSSWGLQARVERPPAIAFLDISGYTRLTDERGDEAARDLATTLSHIVRRSSGQHGGRAVTWLGDGVMFHFPEPARGVVACLEMSDAVIGAGIPPAHVGISAGPVLAQGGDYFGRTVNAASRIAGYARQGEVLVSQDVVDAAPSLVQHVAFEAIGPVELKGLSGTLDLYRAVRTPG
jgi:adenylate cyclase